MDSDSPVEHPLVALLIEDVKPLVKAGLESSVRGLFEKGRGARDASSLELPELEYYYLMSYKKISNLVSAIDTLERIEHFVRWLPPQRRFRELRLSQERWLDYHYSYHLVVMSSLVDLALLAINEVLRLGIPEKSCKYKDIEANYWVRRHKLSDALKTLDSQTQKHRSRRNSFVHHGERPDLAEIIESEDYDVLTLVAGANAMSRQPLAGATLFNEAFKTEIERLVTVMQRERRSAARSVKTLFGALQPVYEAQVTALGRA